jgi:hypothetical protein
MVQLSYRRHRYPAETIHTSDLQSKAAARWQDAVAVA